MSRNNPRLLRRFASLRTCLRTGLALGIFAPAVQAQILNPGPALEPLEPVVRQVERSAERGTERLRDGSEALGKSTGRALDDLRPLGELPAELLIRNRNGTTLFADVVVEDGWRAVERQWIVLLDAGELDSFLQPGFEILEQNALEDLGMKLLRFRVPEHMNSRQALRRVLPSSLVDRLDRNHIYEPQAAGEGGTEAGETRSFCDNPVHIGMIDTAIATGHPAFATSTIIQRNFLDEAIEPARGHGTAVAGLLVGSADGRAGPLPRGTLYNASVFYSRDQYAQGATMMHLLHGLNWLLETDAVVINMSLAGPDNRILAAAVARTLARNKIIVAAAGNEGPAAPPVYPAGYEGVISATAVDRHSKIYRWANRGDHVDFAALGVSVRTARSDGSFGHESGTSMAAPTISALLSCELAGDNAEISPAIQRLMDRAEDLGEPGRDPVFGYGLLR